MNNSPLPPGATGDVFALLRVVSDKDACEARLKELTTLNDQIATTFAEQRNVLTQTEADRAAAETALAQATELADANDAKAATFEAHKAETETALAAREEAVETAEKLLVARTEDLESHMTTREQSVTDRETAATQREQDLITKEAAAEALRAEYADKIDKLKAITGATDAGS